MAKAIVSLPTENRKHEWEEDDPRLANDQALREFFGALAGQYRTADIVRKRTSDGVLEVTITPRAGQKGSDAVLHALLAAPEEIHPVLQLAWALEGSIEGATLSVEERLERFTTIEALADQAEAELKVYHTQLQLLKASPAAPADEVPLGF